VPVYRPWQPLTYLYFPYHCISLIYFSFTKIRMFLYARIYWLAEFGDVSCLQFNYLRVETLTPTWEDICRTIWSDICRTIWSDICRTILRWSPTKLCVRPESLVVDTLGGICMCFRMSCLFVSSILFWFPLRTHYFWRVLWFLFMERKQDYNVTSVKNVKVCF
jgi:hypothetical protein